MQLIQKDYTSQSHFQDWPLSPTCQGGIQLYSLDSGRQLITREIVRRNNLNTYSNVSLPPSGTTRDEHPNLSDAYDLSWLMSRQWPENDKTSGELRVADLFCGCGGLSLGVWEACRALQLKPNYIFACDIDEAALDVYKKNFSPQNSISSPIEQVISGELGASLTKAEAQLKKEFGKIDYLIAGPPCQGHSDLNNHTRRDDPKNQLVLRVARFAEIFMPRWVLIENVQGIRHDRLGALQKATSHLERLGYNFSDGLLQAETIGVAQARRRYFLFASLGAVYPIERIPVELGANPRPLAWAISDLLDKYREESTFNSSARHSFDNNRRINYLFDNDLFELPNHQRPDCHKSGSHSYTSVYGRLYWDRPSPTITTGFGSVGQGRFVHSLKRRTLTPHEAARVQFFPDFFEFSDRGRRQYQSLIGNAVPSKLAYAITIHQLR